MKLNDSYSLTDFYISQCFHCLYLLYHYFFCEFITYSYAAFFYLYDKIFTKRADNTNLTTNIKPKIFQVLFYLRASTNFSDDLRFILLCIN